MTNTNAGLLIAALVAIVAVVGLVILFRGASTGADAYRLPDPDNTCPGNFWNYRVDAQAGTGYWYCQTTGERVVRGVEQQIYLNNY